MKGLFLSLFLHSLRQSFVLFSLPPNLCTILHSVAIAVCSLASALMHYFHIWLDKQFLSSVSKRMSGKKQVKAPIRMSEVSDKIAATGAMSNSNSTNKTTNKQKFVGVRKRQIRDYSVLQNVFWIKTFQKGSSYKICFPVKVFECHTKYQ